jgi:hypothetical protein
MAIRFAKIAIEKAIKVKLGRRQSSRQGSQVSVVQRAVCSMEFNWLFGPQRRWLIAPW